MLCGMKRECVHLCFANIHLLMCANAYMLGKRRHVMRIRFSVCILFLFYSLFRIQGYFVILYRLHL